MTLVTLTGNVSVDHPVLLSTHLRAAQQTSACSACVGSEPAVLWSAHCPGDANPKILPEAKRRRDAGGQTSEQKRDSFAFFRENSAESDLHGLCRRKQFMEHLRQQQKELKFQLDQLPKNKRKEIARQRKEELDVHQREEVMQRSPLSLAVNPQPWHLS